MIHVDKKRQAYLQRSHLLDALRKDKKTSIKRQTKPNEEVLRYKEESYDLKDKVLRSQINKAIVDSSRNRERKNRQKERHKGGS